MKTDIIEQFATYFEKKSISYEHSETHNAIVCYFDLGVELGTITMYVFSSGNLFSVTAYCALRANSTELRNVADYLTRLNSETPLGQFRLDYETKLISCRIVQILEGTMLIEDTLDLCVKVPLHLLQQYGDSIAKVVDGTATPDEAIAAVKRQG